MNIVWVVLLVISSLVLIVINPSAFLPAISAATTKAITLSISLCGIYAFWLGIMQIVSDCGLLKKCTKLLSPLTTLLFGQLDPVTKEFVTLNIAANVLGLGNACTPSGISAVERLSNNQVKANANTIMFIVLNTTSLELIPTTILSLRTTAGSLHPESILLPAIISTLASTVCGVLLVKLCSKIFKGWKNECLCCARFYCFNYYLCNN